MERAASYTRYSSDMQRAESIEAQDGAIKEFAEGKYDIIEHYIDEAQSGKTDDRPAFQRMISDAKEGRFSVVLIHKVNRFGRNRHEIIYYKHKLLKMGVKVVSVAEQFGDGHHAVLMESLMEGMAEFYSLELAAEVMKVLKLNATKARFNGGYVLYGYGVDENKNYIINEEEAAVVRRVFREVLDGRSYGELTKTLPPRRGKPWRANSIHDLLRNEKYTGVYIYNLTDRRKTGNSRKRKPESDVIRIPEGVPQIIDVETYRRVQEIMNTRQNPAAGKRAKLVYLLSGIVVCGECGSPYVGSNRTVMGKSLPMYLCSGKKRGNGCKNKSTGKHIIEGEVLAQVKALAKTIDPVYYAEEYNHYVEEHTAGATDTLNAIEKDLNNIKKKKGNLVAAIEAGGDIPELSRRLRELSQEQEHLEGHRSRVKQDVRKQKVTPQEVTALLDMMIPTGGEAEEALKKMLKALILQVTVTSGQISELSTVLTVDTSGAEGSSPPLSTVLGLLRKEY